MQAEQSSATVVLDQQSIGQQVEISAALKCKTADDYGYCQACDVPISPARLTIKRVSRYCLNCADHPKAG